MHGMRRTGFAVVATVIAMLATAGSVAWPQSSGPIRLILPFAPGGPADTMARVAAEQISVAGGPSMVVESHPGAGTEIGTEYVSRATPDGNTLGIISNSFVVLPLIRKLNYDPFTDFAPICKLADFPPLIAVNSDSPYRTFADLLNAARAEPGKLTIGSIGPATSSQMTIEMIKYAAKVNMTFVPFAGYTPAIQAALGNQITAVYADYASLQGHLQSGKLRALVTTSRKRVTALPDVPTAVEAGYNVEEEFFGGVVAPAKIPKSTVSSLIDMFTAAMQQPALKAKYASLGYFAGGECGADYAAVLRKDYEDYKRIIHDANLKMD
jgi:tripartite-type tricarboxylate transporter receptor subunit TctC